MTNLFAQDLVLSKECKGKGVFCYDIVSARRSTKTIVFTIDLADRAFLPDRILGRFGLPSQILDHTTYLK